MVLKTEYTVAGIIIALLIGSGAGYIYGQSPIAGYKEEVDRLETENLGIREKKAQLLEEYTNLQDQLTEVKKDLSSTRSSLENLKACGKIIKKEAEICPLCGVRQKPGLGSSPLGYSVGPPSGKSKMAGAC